VNSTSDCIAGESLAPGRDWFGGRRDHCTRQVLADFFYLVDWFQKLYGQYLAARCPGKGETGGWSGQQGEDIQVELLAQLSAMVGTEKKKGLLWQLKDLCHQVWPQETRQQHLQGGLVDWLVGSLFHEAMKLKENLYLLNNYSTAAVAVDCPGDYTSWHRRPSPAMVRLVDMGALVVRITGDVARQIERMGFLFGQVKYLLRMMLPDLVANMLILRLLAEQEKAVGELWGESLEELFADIFASNPASGFCQVGASYLQGQWYPQSQAMYRRALACDRNCDQAIIRLAHLGIILRDAPAFLYGK